MSSLVTIRRCASLPEALITVSFLQSRGVEASLDNYHHAAVNWLIVPALNGIGVSVPARDIEVAKQEIVDAISADKNDFELEYGAYETPPPVSKLPVWCFWAAILGVPWLLYSILVAILELLIPAQFVPRAPWPSEITNACSFGYSCSSYDNLSYSMTSVEFSFFRLEAQTWWLILVLIGLQLFYCGLLALFGTVFTLNSKKLLNRRHAA
ncbi:MAG TPA: hypothetical protein EYG02_05010 [Henriciella marina]|uniref:hypothetical protein n=1 Tax=Henriciella sp. TaxID=1968823 RepID=UPI00179E7300|nr:hypothetical protein [Henriciella sp.]HIG21481.1 hypothetical protein [Henriciella sp.]HIK64370.1 hypothetical protein [Henriciella marina]